MRQLILNFEYILHGRCFGEQCQILTFRGLGVLEAGGQVGVFLGDILAAGALALYLNRQFTELCERLLIMVRGKIAYEGSSPALDLAGLKQAYQSCTGVSA